MTRSYRRLDLDARRTLLRLMEARRPLGEIAARLGRQMGYATHWRRTFITS